MITSENKFVTRERRRSAVRISFLKLLTMRRNNHAPFSYNYFFPFFFSSIFKSATVLPHCRVVGVKKNCLTAGLCVLKILPHCRVAGTWINILSDRIRKLKPNKQLKKV